MITWITGNSGAGKSTLANELEDDQTLILDGDEIRTQITGYDMSRAGRWQHNINVAKWAKLIENQGMDVIVAMICPYEILRQEVKVITDCKFIYIEFEGDDQIEDKPYEKPLRPDVKIASEVVKSL